jgi:hypothetical protein
MKETSLKLKQASAVLETTPKELQNLVQFGVVKPTLRAGLYVFDANALYAAKVALFLKKALGTNTELLSEFTGALSERLPSVAEGKKDAVVFRSRPSPGTIAVEVKVPFRALAQQVEERVRLVGLFKDLPRGRKRRGWKSGFLATLKEAAQDMGEVSQEEIRKAIREHRNQKKRTPEVTVEAEPRAARA